MILLQKLTISEDVIERAIKYYSIINALLNMKLTKRQVQLLAFTAVRGTITPKAAKKDFQEKFKTSEDSVNNIKSQLTRKKLLVKEGGMYRVHPRIRADFSKDIVLQISINGPTQSDS